MLSLWLHEVWNLRILQKKNTEPADAGSYYFLLKSQTSYPVWSREESISLFNYVPVYECQNFMKCLVKINQWNYSVPRILQTTWNVMCNIYGISILESDRSTTLENRMLSATYLKIKALVSLPNVYTHFGVILSFIFTFHYKC